MFRNKKVVFWGQIMLFAALCFVGSTLGAGESGDFTNTDNGAGIPITNYTGAEGNVPALINSKAVTNSGSSTASSSKKVPNVDAKYFSSKDKSYNVLGDASVEGDLTVNANLKQVSTVQVTLATSPTGSCDSFEWSETQEGNLSGGTGTYTFNSGNIIELYLLPSNGYYFQGFTVEGNITVHSYYDWEYSIININSAGSITANFAEKSPVNLTISENINGATGTDIVYWHNLTTGASGSAFGTFSFSKGDEIELEMYRIEDSSSNYHFIGLNYDENVQLIGLENNTEEYDGNKEIMLYGVFILLGDTEITFKYRSNLELAANPIDGLDTMHWNNETTSEQGVGVGNYTFTPGDIIQVQATPAPGYSFAYWNYDGDMNILELNGDTIRFESPACATLIANFTKDGTQLDISESPFNCRAYDVLADADGNAYVVGDFTKIFDLGGGFNFIFDGSSGASEFLANGSSGFLVKYTKNNDGNWGIPMPPDTEPKSPGGLMQPYIVKDDKSGGMIIAGVFNDLSLPN